MTPPGGIVQALRDAGVNNPVFILEAVDRAAKDDVEVLLAVLDPRRRSAFNDDYLQAPVDLAPVMWMVTATAAGAIPSALLKYLDVVELPPYTEKEKLTIAQEHLLKRPFHGSAPASRGLLAPESALSGGLPASASSAADPVVLVDRPVASLDELEMFALGPPPQACAAEASWRMAASRGDVRFEPDALRRVIRSYTNEAGVADLDGKLAEICREVVRSRSASPPGPQVVTAALVPQLLRDGFVEQLPSFVRDAIATERRRLSSDSASDSTETNDWIEWLEHLPWTRCNDAPIDLVRIRAALDAGQARPRGRQGQRHRASGRAEAQSGRRRRGPLFRRPPGSGEDVAGPEHRRRPGAPFRQAVLRGPAGRDRPAGSQPHLEGRAARLDPP